MQPPQEPPGPLDPVVQARLREDPEYGPAMMRAGQTGAATPEEVERALGPSAGESVRRALAGERPGEYPRGALPTEIPAGQPAAERGVQMEEPDFIKGLQSQARSQNRSDWDKVANNLESYIKNAQRGGLGTSLEEKTYLQQIYKQLNPDARVMPDVVPLRTQAADPAIIQEAQRQYPNDPRAREAYIDANWNKITPELQATRDAQRLAAQGPAQLQQRIDTLRREADTAAGQRGGGGRAAELTRHADALERQMLGVGQPARGGVRAPADLTQYQAAMILDKLQNQYRRAQEAYGNDESKWPDAYRDLSQLIETYKGRARGGGDGNAPTASLKRGDVIVDSQGRRRVIQ